MFHLIPAPLHRALLRAAYAVRHRFRRVIRPRLRGVSVIVSDDADRVLLVRHSYGSGSWSLPGGGCGRRERPDHAARREIREELTLELDALDLVATFEETISGAPHTAYVFTAIAAGEVRRDNREIIASGYFAMDDLPHPLNRITAARLAAWRGEG